STGGGGLRPTQVHIPNRPPTEANQATPHRPATLGHNEGLLMKKIVGSLAGIIFLALITWIGWKFQPWMPAGRAVHISSEHLGNCVFEVWQRKNDAITEPFATGLFARVEGGPWKAFLLDFVDTYHPPFLLLHNVLLIEVYSARPLLVFLDEARHNFD